MVPKDKTNGLNAAPVSWLLMETEARRSWSLSQIQELSSRACVWSPRGKTTAKKNVSHYYRRKASRREAGRAKWRRLRVYHLWHGVHVCSWTKPSQLFIWLLWVAIRAQLCKCKCHNHHFCKSLGSSCLLRQLHFAATEYRVIPPGWGWCHGREFQLSLPDSTPPSFRALLTRGLATLFWSSVILGSLFNHWHSQYPLNSCNSLHSQT